MTKYCSFMPLVDGGRFNNSNLRGEKLMRVPRKWLSEQEKVTILDFL